MRSPITWVIVLGIAVAGGAFLLWRHSQSASSSSSTGTTGTSTGDQTDYSGQIATLQTEIEDLQSGGAQDNDSGSGTAGTGSSGGGTSGTGSSGGSTGTKTPAKPKIPGMPTSVVGAAAGTSSLKLSWGKVSGATSYQVRVTYQGKLAGSSTTSSTAATVSGLAPNRTYTAHVKACNAAGCSSETNGPVVHTPKAA